MGNPVTDALTALEGEIPGLAIIGEVITQLDDMAKEVSKYASEITSGHGHEVLSALLQNAGNATGMLQKLTKLTWDDISNYGTGTLFKTFLEGGLNLNYEKMNGEAKDSIKTIDSMLTFATLFPLSITAADAILSFFLGQRAPKLSESVLGRLSEELGLTWAMGMTIDRAFETAIGNKLEEAILYQKRPIDPEIQLLRLMLRQHLIDEPTLLDRAKHMGYSDAWAEKFAKLADAQIPVGDLQQLYLHGQIKSTEIDGYLEGLGFNPADRSLLQTLYVDKAETAAGGFLRSVARAAYEKDLIEVGDYERIQVQTNMPALEIIDDLTAIAMEKTLGKILVPVSAIKLQYEHGDLIDATATPLLAALGYTPDAITALLKAWNEPRLPHPMSASKVLTYWYSGVLTDPQDATARLVATGLRAQDATFLLNNPPAGGARRHALTPALVQQAYLDGVIEDSGLEAALTKAGLVDPQLGYAAGVARFKKTRMKRPSGASVPLTSAQILDAMKVGVFDPATAQTSLEKLGYSPDDALTLIEIKDKGNNPFLKGAAPLFKDLPSAIAYLEAHGYAVTPPPDPQLVAAEQMVLQAGWSYTPTGGGIAGLPGLSVGGTPGPIIPPNLPGPIPGS
jgi:hypothetical protein